MWLQQELPARREVRRSRAASCLQPPGRASLYVLQHKPYQDNAASAMWDSAPSISLCLSAEFAVLNRHYVEAKCCGTRPGASRASTSHRGRSDRHEATRHPRYRRQGGGHRRRARRTGGGDCRRLRTSAHGPCPPRRRQFSRRPAVRHSPRQRTACLSQPRQPSTRSTVRKPAVARLGTDGRVR